MINLKTYEKILENPSDRKKLFDSGFDANAYDNYAEKYALNFSDTDLLKTILSHGGTISNKEWLKQLVKTDFSEDKKLALDFLIKGIATSPRLHIWMSELDINLSKEVFGTFAEYFFEYIDDFSVSVKKYFFNYNKFYPINSLKTLEFVKKMYLVSKRYMVDIVDVPHVYFGRSNDFERVMDKIHPSYIDNLIVFFIEEAHLNDDHVVVAHFVKWAKENLLSYKTIFTMISKCNLSYLTKDELEKKCALLKKKYDKNSEISIPMQEKLYRIESKNSESEKPLWGFELT